MTKEQNTQESRNTVLAIIAIAAIVAIALFFIFRGGANDDNEAETANTAVTQTAAAALAVDSSSSTPTDTPATSTPLATPAIATAEPTVTPEEEPTTTPPPPTGTPANIATAQLNASIFAEPDADSAELDFIAPGEAVTVFEEQGSWIRVANDEGIEGWAAANRFDITAGPPTATPTVTNTPEALTAVTTDSASLFTGPGVDFEEQAIISTDATVTVLGRSASETWLFVRTDDNEVGWVALSRLDFSEDVASLPLFQTIVTPAPSDETSSETGDEAAGDTANEGGFALLTFDFWDLPNIATCDEADWTLPLYMEGRGGDGRYTYFIDGQEVAGPISGSYTYDYAGSGDANVRITGRITSSDGQSTQIILFAEAPTCEDEEEDE